MPYDDLEMLAYMQIRPIIALTVDISPEGCRTMHAGRQVWSVDRNSPMQWRLPWHFQSQKAVFLGQAWRHWLARHWLYRGRIGHLRHAFSGVPSQPRRIARLEWWNRYGLGAHVARSTHDTLYEAVRSQHGWKLCTLCAAELRPLQLSHWT